MARIHLVLPIFCYSMQKTPQQIIDEREEQFKSDDRKIRYYYEDKLDEFRQYLIDHHYGARTVKAYLGRVAGLFSNNRLDLMLDKNFWAKSNKMSSEIAQAITSTKRYPDNDEMRLIIELADNQQALAILFGYHCGLTPTDVVSLTWDRLNVDFEQEKREFIHVEAVRDKTGVDHVIILNPDILHFLRAHWLARDKPSTGWVFEGYNDTAMNRRNLNYFFKDLAIKALGETRGGELTFKDLRDSFNEAILDSEVNEEIKDILMGHVRPSAKGNYSFSTASVVRIYREQIFPKIAINGWALKEKASEVDQLRDEVKRFRKALNLVESENTAYKTRVDNLQSNLEDVREVSVSQSGEIKELTETVNDMVESVANWHKDYDILYMWIRSKGDNETIREFKEIRKKMKYNWDDDVGGVSE
jgi:integrase